MSTATHISFRPGIRQATSHLTVAAVSAGLAVALTLQISGTDRAGAPAAPHNTALCSALANATPGSPAAFRLADQTAGRGC